MLTIRIERSGVKGNLEIRCSAEFISGPVTWDNADIEIVQREAGGTLIQDRNAGLRILATVVELAENVKPVFVGS